MIIKRSVINGCCGRQQIVLKIDRPITLTLFDVLKNNGFDIADHFTKAGMLYATNLELIITGPIGMNKLNVKCKNENCDQFLNDFEELLKKTE